ncbi:MAG: D-lyxose/D-mannose family sugar isomerase [Rhodobacteraceae bacterium]|nr:D-lyxose/D-mannose family sugar isomerase [Paracoccaceae bacterium]
MLRSEVNAILAAAEALVARFGVALPPFARWTPDEFRARRAAAAAIVEARLGWDVTDYGQGDFARLGLVLFTLRNGRPADPGRGGGRCYAEKLLISRERQVAPMHTHRRKAEDIINRAGATLCVELFASGPDGGPDPRARGSVCTDGIERPFGPGEVLRLAPGESVTLLPGDWHAFWAEGGDVLAGEVSTVNDDLADNVFRDPVGRFAGIEEDAPPRRLLVADYDRRLA